MTYNEKLWNAYKYAMDKLRTAYAELKTAHFTEYRAALCKYERIYDLTTRRTKACEHALKLYPAVRPRTPMYYANIAPLTKDEEKTIYELFAEMEESNSTK